MPKKCEICGKIGQTGHTISHAHNVTKRRWQPNLQRVKVKIDGTPQKIYVCTQCIRTGAIEKVT